MDNNNCTTQMEAIKYSGYMPNIISLNYLHDQ